MDMEAEYHLNCMPVNKCRAPINICHKECAHANHCLQESYLPKTAMPPKKVPRLAVSPTDGVTEYYDEYCIGYRIRPNKTHLPHIIEPVRTSEALEPVGGRNQAKAREMHQQYLSMQQNLRDGPMVANVYSDAERGCHRMLPQWRDPRWSNGTRIESSTQYHPADRDPSHRNQFYMYNSTSIEPMRTPIRPMAVPDVHKLRYMHGTYVNYDDWY